MRKTGILLLAIIAFTAVRYARQPDVRAQENADDAPLRNCGDVNGDGRVDISDVPYLARYLFLAGPDLACAPEPARFPACSQQVGRFIDNADGTVTDTCTGLMWQKDTADVNGDGSYSLDDDRLTFRAAIEYCDQLTLAGHDDWRLPRIEELLTIVNYNAQTPATFGDFFRVQGGRNWAVGGTGTGLRELVDFDDAGSVHTRIQSSSRTEFFRAVRDAK